MSRHCGGRSAFRLGLRSSRSRVSSPRTSYHVEAPGARGKMDRMESVPAEFQELVEALDSDEPDASVPSAEGQWIIPSESDWAVPKQAEQAAGDDGAAADAST